jgi:DNA invertase Pin-like site-specific DNA recombinase
MRRAFSYLRFSKPEQCEGRSLKRQIQATEAYCKRHGLTLDKRTFRDLGLSGYTGSNAAAGELADFIDLVKSGRIPKGSVLIVENTDRLSRLPPDKASALICDIVRAGVDIVTTSPEATYTADNLTKLGTWLPLQVSCALAHEESVKKADRLADVWAAKRQVLADGPKDDKEAKLARRSKRCPSWLRLTADRTGYVVREDKARMVRDLFTWSLEGLGIIRICERLQERHPAGLKGKGWQPGYVRDLLRCRAVMGEFQPHTGSCAKKGVKKTRKPVGEPLAGYYPAVVPEETFLRVQAGLDVRRNRKLGGRDRGTPNLFNGYAFDAHDGHRLVLGGNHGHPRLVSAGAIRKLAGCGFRTIPYAEFEAAVLTLLSELKVADVVGPRNGAQKELEAASAALTAVNYKVGQAQARVVDAADPSVFLDLLERLGAERKAAVKRLEAAKVKVAHESADGFGECQTLISLLKDADDDGRADLRRKVRAAMTRLIESVYVLPVRPRRHTLLCAVQVVFHDRGTRRSYLVRIARGEGWQVRSLAGVTKSDDLDLRQPADARELAALLESLDIAALAEAMR